MKRTVLIATAIAMLVSAAAAYAALNTYTASISFSHGSGSAKAPVPVSEVLNLGAANVITADRAAPLVDIDTKYYGLVSNGGKFPTCSAALIDKAPGFNANCPKGSLLATGRVHSMLGDPTLTGGAQCDPYLSVYNGGAGKQWYFFSTKTAADCAGLTTGATAPYPGFVKQQGKYLDVDVPLPADISTQVAGHKNFYGSLIQETLTFPKQTTKVKGKPVGVLSSIGCLKGKRPWSVKYTATNGSGTTESKTVTGSAKC